MIQKAAQWLAEAQNPMFLVGPEIYQDGAEKEIKELAEKLSVPVAELGWPNELHANFPTDHVLFVGKLNAQRIPRSVDLLINFGEKFATGRGSPFRGTPVVHVSNDPDILGKVFPADLAIASDMRVGIRDISDAVDALLTKDRQARIRSKRLEEISTLTNALKQSRQMALRGRFDTSPLSWERVGYELEQALEKDAVIVPEVGTQSVKLLGQLKFGIDNKLRIGRTTGSALGWGVAAALGVNLALPERQVVSIQGDGGILFGQTETLWSIARYEAPMLIVVMNNGVYNDSRVRNMSGGGVLYEAGYDFNGYLGNPDVDFTKIAEAYSLKGERVRNASDLAPALKRALNSMRDGKAVVLDVKVAPDGQPLSQPTWYPRHSITEIRNKRRAD
jgi:thiamine pyrophosphate-dependent acetolactate synthase large subunit-like protein